MFEISSKLEVFDYSEGGPYNNQKLKLWESAYLVANIHGLHVIKIGGI